MSADLTPDAFSFALSTANPALFQSLHHSYFFSQPELLLKRLMDLPLRSCCPEYDPPTGRAETGRTLGEISPGDSP